MKPTTQTDLDLLKKGSEPGAIFVIGSWQHHHETGTTPAIIHPGRNYAVTLRVSRELAIRAVRAGWFEVHRTPHKMDLTVLKITEEGRHSYLENHAKWDKLTARILELEADLAESRIKYDLDVDMTYDTQNILKTDGALSVQQSVLAHLRKSANHFVTKGDLMIAIRLGTAKEPKSRAALSNAVMFLRQKGLQVTFDRRYGYMLVEHL